jgi:threonine dehydrogenase-like Zn-dependent dehydrogenase
VDGSLKWAGVIGQEEFRLRDAARVHGSARTQPPGEFEQLVTGLADLRHVERCGSCPVRPRIVGGGDHVLDAAGDPPPFTAAFELVREEGQLRVTLGTFAAGERAHQRSLSPEHAQAQQGMGMNRHVDVFIIRVASQGVDEKPPRAIKMS